MTVTQNKPHLSVLTDEYEQHLNELLELLQLEREALKNREFESIRACTEQKGVLLNKLEQLDTQRKITGEASEKPISEKIISLLKKCSEMNIVNGSIVEISKQFNQRMLRTILGAPPHDSDLYDAEGNNSSNKLKQVFAKI